MLESYLAAKTALVLPAHAGLETYSVPTRLPMPHRLRPTDAMQLIAGNLSVFTDVAGIHGPSVVD